MKSQLIPVGNAFLLLANWKVPPHEGEAMRRFWEEHLPGVGLLIVSECVLRDIGHRVPVFEFTGKVTPEIVDEFKAWWDEHWKDPRPVPPKPDIPIAEGCADC